VIIIVTGGVCSSLGKGVATSSIGALLECAGVDIGVVKCDPYLNVDAGTMSPYQHGEVFVTDDGAETDLDLGNYARFTNANLTKANSITTGQIYHTVIEHERKGDYLGKCVQIVPHVTDEIKHRILNVAKNHEVTLVEMGGTVGDMEGVSFLEAARQLKHDYDVVNVHLTLVPLVGKYELKTKPTQHSCREMQENGLQPDILICRVPQEYDGLPEDMVSKIAAFTNVKKEAVFVSPDLKSIYQLPMVFHEQGLDAYLLKLLRQDLTIDITPWQEVNDAIDSLKPGPRIAVVGKYVDLFDSYKSIWEAIYHAGLQQGLEVDAVPVDAEGLLSGKVTLDDFDGILVPGGFGDRGVEGMIEAAKYARENKIPYFGICLGMQVMVIEYARNILGLQDADSTEFTRTCNPVISLMSEQDLSYLGGTMRLGAYDETLIPGSIVHKAYSKSIISERHRHRYEFNNFYRERFHTAGLIVTGTTADKIVECVEWNDHPFGLGVQFHPEFKSRPTNPAPIFKAFIKASYLQK
jgi:CTP synthase